MAFADALDQRSTTDLTDARDKLVAAVGQAGAERAAGVVATFQMMNRLLDGVGAPVNNRKHFEPIAEALGFRLSDIPR